MDLKAVKKAHFIGIAGVGMSATAFLLRDMGITVTGSDEEVYDPMLSYLQKQGLKWQSSYAAKNIPEDADLIVIGKNAKLIPESNEEVAAAMRSGKQIASYPEVMAALTVSKEAVVVAGSYGKSSSTALLAHCLEQAGTNPSYFIGAVPQTPPQSARIGSSNLFVLEGDEYPSSNTDSRAKFLHYHPKHVLITPLAHDHFNVFSTPADYVQPFIELVGMVEGIKVICVEGVLSGELLARVPQAVTYGVTHGTYQAANIVWGETTTFDLTKDGKTVTALQTTLLGEHNVQNIVGVAALILSLNLMSAAKLAAGLASFKGIKRRLDRKSERTSIPIFEGFGSSYEKLHSAIAAMKLHFPTKRLVIVFEPHTFSWRNRESLPWYDTVFAGAEAVYIFEPPHDGKETQLTLTEMVERVAATGIATKGATQSSEILAALEQNLHANDAILLSTSGDLGGLIESIPALADKKFPLA